MKEFFPIETPYSSEDYKIMDIVCKKRNDFPKSQFTKSPHFINKFLWNIHYNELPILYTKLENLYNETGNDDVLSWLEDIQSVASKYEPGPQEPAKPDYAMNEEEADDDMTDEMEESVDLEATYMGEEAAPQKSAVERFVDMISGGAAAEIEESGSDNLTNLHGTNLKPSPIDEWKESGRYEDIVFLQGDNALRALETLTNFGSEAALNFLKKWHNPGEGKRVEGESHGAQDKVYKKDGYIMSWNSRIPYIGLQYDTEQNAKKATFEDNIMMRNQAGQRNKTAPLGRHSPHSQNAK